MHSRNFRKGFKKEGIQYSYFSKNKVRKESSKEKASISFEFRKKAGLLKKAQACNDNVNNYIKVFTYRKNGNKLQIGIIQYEDLPIGAIITESSDPHFMGEVFNDVIEVKGGAFNDIYHPD